MPFLKNFFHRKSLTQISSLPELQKNPLSYEGGFLSNLQVLFENISHPFLLSFQPKINFNCSRETWVLGAKMKGKNASGGAAKERERKRKEPNSREEERQMYVYTQVR